MSATRSQSTRVKPLQAAHDHACNSQRCARCHAGSCVTRPCRVAAGDATCALIVAFDVINLEKGATAPGETTRTRSKSADVALTGKMGRSDLCLRAPVDAPKLEWIAPAFPKPGGPFGPAFLITTAK